MIAFRRGYLTLYFMKASIRIKNPGFFSCSTFALWILHALKQNFWRTFKRENFLQKGAVQEKKALHCLEENIEA